METRHRGPGNNNPPFWNKVYDVTVCALTDLIKVPIKMVYEIILLDIAQFLLNLNLF